MLTIKVTPNVFSDRFRAKVHSDITSLEMILGNKPSYVQRHQSVKFGLIGYAYSTPPFEYLESREVSKCFKSIVTALQDLLDELIALVKLSEDELIVKRVRSENDIHEFFNVKNAEKLMDVSTDHSLNVPKKLRYLLDEVDDEVIIESLQSLFNIRNGLEHHKGIAKSDKAIKFKKVTLIDEDGKELSQLGIGTKGVKLTTIEEVIQYDKGNNLHLEKDQLYSIVMNLLTTTIAKLIESVYQLMRQNPTPVDSDPDSSLSD